MREFIDGMAEILEVRSEQISPEFSLHSADAAWDSLAIVSTIALVDDCFNLMLDGQALVGCLTIGDIEVLVEIAKKK
uniref:acyl carrier protein n=1 Tax=Polynucleobacter sp. TaxID=2029855 RepID=UPI004047DA00